MSEANGPTGSISIDTKEIEEKLKKILDNQSTNVGATALLGDGQGIISEAAQAEIEKLTVVLKEKEKQIEEIKATAAQAPAAAGGDIKKYEEKVKELETRLQEYEIIAEDIADLSFYKEENNKLQKELSAYKSGGAAPASEPTPKVEPPVQAPPPVEAKIELEPPPPKPAEPAPPPAPVEASIEAKPTGVDDGPSIDEDILKQFAAAVEDQKKQTSEEKSAEENKLTESKELMGQFENFIKKG